MVAVVPVSPEAIVDAILKPKKVRKAVLKPENAQNSPNNAKTASIFLKTLQNAWNIEAFRANRIQNRLIKANIFEKDFINPKIQAINETIESKIPTTVAKRVRVSKQLSKKGEIASNNEQMTPIIPDIAPILDTTAPINGVQETTATIISPTDIYVDPSIPNAAVVEAALKRVLKKVGRPLGSLDKVKREAKGENKLGRPLGAKDRAPRKSRSANPNEVNRISAV